jgi:NAD(P)-dependent dehydrogenase (short-subunit alcohol dehydrogenase family)
MRSASVDQVRQICRRFPTPLDQAYAQLGEVSPLADRRSPEVAALIAFLLSARGSYITGVAINADGSIRVV